jgi:hypothetical protein
MRTPTQPSAAMNIQAYSDDINLPFKATVVNGEGVATNLGAFSLKSGTGTFVTSQVLPGMIVWNTTAGLSALVVSVPDENTLILSANIFTTIGDGYKIFSGYSDGAMIMSCDSRSGDIRVLTEGGDDVIFYNFPTNKVLPVKVVRVFSTDTTALYKSYGS